MCIASHFHFLSFFNRLYFRFFSRNIASRNLASSLLAGMHSALVAFQFKYLRLDWALWSIACRSVYRRTHSANSAHDRICTESHDGRNVARLFQISARKHAVSPSYLTLSPFPSLSLSLFLYFPSLDRTVRRRPQEGSETRTRLCARRNRKRLRFPLFASGPRAFA